MKLVMVSGQEDWTGLYGDGKLLIEDHSLDVDHVLELLMGHSVESYTWLLLEGEADKKLNDIGCLPETLEELGTWQKL